MILLYTLFNFFFFSAALNFCYQWFPSENIVFLSRRYSSLHALGISLLMVLHLYFKWQFFMIFGLSFTLAYAIFDLCMIITNPNLYHDTHWTMYIHHMVLGFLTYWIHDQPIYYMSAEYGLIAEFSTFIFNQTWFLIKYHAPPNQIKLWSFLTLVAWFILRNCNFTYIFYYYFGMVEWVPLMGLFYLWIVNALWFHKLLIRYQKLE